MRNVLVCMHDAKSETWTAPRAEPSVGAALRNFADAINDSQQNSILQNHPEDFTLYHIADYDINTGLITLIDKKALANGLDVKIDPANVDQKVMAL